MRRSRSATLFTTRMPNQPPEVATGVWNSGQQFVVALVVNGLQTTLKVHCPEPEGVKLSGCPTGHVTLQKPRLVRSLDSRGAHSELVSSERCIPRGVQSLPFVTVDMKKRVVVINRVRLRMRKYFIVGSVSKEEFIGEIRALRATFVTGLLTR